MIPRDQIILAEIQCLLDDIMAGFEDDVLNREVEMSVKNLNVVIAALLDYAEELDSIFDPT